MGININRENPRDFNNFSNADGDDDHFSASGKLRAKLKKKLADAKKGIHDARKNIHDTTHKLGHDLSKKIGDDLGGGKFVHAANKVNPVFIGVRAGLLGLLKENVVGIAHAFSLIKDGDSAHWDKIKQKFWMWGGDKGHLDSAVEHGKNKPAVLQNIVDKFQEALGRFQGQASDDGSNQLSPGTTVAKSVSDMFILVKALATIPSPDPFTKSVSIMLKGVTIGIKDLGGNIQSFAKEHGASSEDVKGIPHTPLIFKKH